MSTYDLHRARQASPRRAARALRIVLALALAGAWSLTAPGAGSPAVAAGELPMVSIGSLWTAEGNVGSYGARIPVTLDRPATHPVVVRVDVEAGWPPEVAATPGVDFRLRSRTVTIPAGKTSSYVRVEILGDREPEEDELAWVRVRSVEGAEPGRLTGELFVLDDDRDPGAQPTLSVGRVLVVEGDAGTVTAWVPVVLSAPLAEPVSVYWAPAYPREVPPTPYHEDVAFDDVVARPEMIWIPAGQTARNLPLRIHGDTTVEALLETLDLQVQVWGDPALSVKGGNHQLTIVETDRGRPSPVRDLTATPLTGDGAGFVEVTWSVPERGMYPDPALQRYSIWISRDGGESFAIESEQIGGTSRTLWCGTPSVRCTVRVAAAFLFIGHGEPAEVEVTTPPANGWGDGEPAGTAP
ncbi:hypothetical protein [Rhabdothermincola sediminis]|uniref:hypothetical protein n=1 Tax=Rhabdothermincola sediminis TaxID=2751370 RepID=UPI001AA0985E|nr:hypothetical protein [Rhabdothermincola sediminis]